MEVLNKYMKMVKEKCQRGVAMTGLALSLPILLGIAALSFDLGRAFIAHNNLQAAADEAALAGMKSLMKQLEKTSPLESDVKKAVEMAAKHAAYYNDTWKHNVSTVVDSKDIYPGTYNPYASTFVKSATYLNPTVNSIRVDIGLSSTSGGNEPVIFNLIKMLGGPAKAIFTVKGVATFTETYVGIALDRSNSMDRNRNALEPTNVSRYTSLANCPTAGAAGPPPPEIDGSPAHERYYRYSAYNVDTYLSWCIPNAGTSGAYPYTAVLSTMSGNSFATNNVWTRVKTYQMIYDVFGSNYKQIVGPVTDNSKAVSSYMAAGALGHINYANLAVAYPGKATYFDVMTLSQGIGGDSTTIASPYGGNTNHMAVLNHLMTQIATQAAKSKKPSAKFVVMMSDGLPNCLMDPTSCNPLTNTSANTQTWVKSNYPPKDIKISSLFFISAELCNPTCATWTAEVSQGAAHMSQLASITGGKFFLSTDLADFANDLQQTFVFGFTVVKPTTFV